MIGLPPHIVLFHDERVISRGSERVNRPCAVRSPIELLLLGGFDNQRQGQLTGPPALWSETATWLYRMDRDGQDDKGKEVISFCY